MQFRSIECNEANDLRAFFRNHYLTFKGPPAFERFLPWKRLVRKYPRISYSRGFLMHLSYDTPLVGVAGRIFVWLIVAQTKEREHAHSTVFPSFNPSTVIRLAETGFLQEAWFLNDYASFVPTRMTLGLAASDLGMTSVSRPLSYFASARFASTGMLMFRVRWNLPNGRSCIT